MVRRKESLCLISVLLTFDGSTWHLNLQSFWLLLCQSDGWRKDQWLEREALDTITSFSKLENMTMMLSSEYILVMFFSLKSICNGWSSSEISIELSPFLQGKETSLLALRCRGADGALLEVLLACGFDHGWRGEVDFCMMSVLPWEGESSSLGYACFWSCLGRERQGSSAIGWRGGLLYGNLQFTKPIKK